MTVAQAARQTLERARWYALEPGDAVHLIEDVLTETPLKFFDAIRERPSTVHTVLGSVRELARAGVSPAHAVGFTTSARARDLGRVYDAFLDRLRHKKQFDASSAELLAQRLEPEPLPTLVCGFTYLDAAQIGYVNTVSGPQSLVTLPVGVGRTFSEGWRRLEALKMLGWAHEKLQTGLPQTVGDATTSFAGLREATPISFASYPTLESEVRGVLGRMRALLDDGIPSAQIAVVARDEKGTCRRSRQSRASTACR